MPIYRKGSLLKYSRFMALPERSYRYTLRSDKRDVRELKTIQDWVIERNFRAVPGVADIVSFGGEVKTFEVSVNPIN